MKSILPVAMDRASSPVPRRALLAAGIVLGALLTPPLLACGPDFPMTLLDRRELVMQGLPEGSFSFEAARLMDKPGDALVLVESDYWTSTPDEDRAKAEALGLKPEAAAVIVAMRAAESPAAALLLGESLPREIQLYTAGAVAWSLGELDQAEDLFRQVVELAPGEHRQRGVWASYMLGRLRALSADRDGAVAAFELTRAWARAGASDPLGLAITSLGEQARVERVAGDVAAAARLYAEQAAYGSNSGNNSLLFLARASVRDPAQVDALLTDPVGTRLLLAYLYSRYNELIEVDPEEEYPSYYEPADGPRMLALLDRIAAAPTVPNSDRLAAVAYRAGRFDQAAALASKLQTPLSAWVRAKLALRAGQLDVAAQAYAEAAQAFPVDENWGEVPLAGDAVERETLKPHCRVQAEAGTLALSRGDYLQAMDLLYAGADLYWADVAYLGERVLSVDELRGFVTRVAPEAVPVITEVSAATATAPDAAVDADAEDSEQMPYQAPTPAAQLRWLLARRLLREGQLEASLAYFDDPQIREQAKRYVAARARTSSWTRTEQARAWFEAAEIARWHGLEIMGYEGDPDYLIWGGNYDLNSPITWDENYQPVFNPRQDLNIDGPYTSDDERQRVAASRAKPLARFHYRLVAAGHAGKAADILPARSQAFAAVLCEASHWLIDREPEEAQTIYRRYLRRGAFVPWGADFGRVCPLPNFDKVEAELRTAWLRRVVRYAAMGMPILLLLALGWTTWRRRRDPDDADSR
jgi:cellulose synthase operon protein C